MLGERDREKGWIGDLDGYFGRIQKNLKDLQALSFKKIQVRH